MEFGRGDPPILITGAARSHEDQVAARKRRYLTMMLSRMVCFVAAGIFHTTWWLAVGLVLLSIPLPWIAVLMANDTPPREVENANPYHSSPRTVEDGEHLVIDVPPART